MLSVQVSPVISSAFIRPTTSRVLMMRKSALVGLALSLLVICMPIEWTNASPAKSERALVGKMPFYVRAYVFDPEQNDRYWNVTQFHVNEIEAHQDIRSMKSLNCRIVEVSAV